MRNYRWFLIPLLHVATAIAAAQGGSPSLSGKPVVWQEVMPVVPGSLSAMWDAAEVVVRVRIDSQNSRFVGNGPSVVTEHHGVILRVFKGDEKVGGPLTFVQAAGEMELPEKIIRVDGPPPLAPKHEYIVFLKTWPAAGALNLVGNHSGAFRVEHGGIRPEGFGPVAEQHRNLSEERFINELDRVATRRQPR